MPDSPFDSPASLAEAMRTGNTDALAAIYDARAASVYAYCRIVCGSAGVDDAVVASFREFLASVTRSSGPIDLDNALALATRRAAGARCELIKPRQPNRRGRRRSAPAVEPVCREMPSLLAARANGESTPDDDGEVREHMLGCPVCRATALRLRHAERAFERLPRDSPDPALRAAILSGEGSS